MNASWRSTQLCMLLCRRCSSHVEMKPAPLGDGRDGARAPGVGRDGACTPEDRQDGARALRVRRGRVHSLGVGGDGACLPRVGRDGA
jgi:hypothetical protein